MSRRIYLSQAEISQKPSGRRSGGFTLLEVMIAVTVTLLMMLGLAQMFKVLGDSINKGRSGLELNNRLRGVMHRIRTDLDNVTAPARPPLPVGQGQGYFKYYEGPASDYTFANNPLLNRFGDVDDIFMATVKAKDTWFTGKVPRFIAEKRTPTPADFSNIEFVTIASQFAEVVIYAQPEISPDGMVRGRLHYRALLIRPDLNLANTGNLPAGSTPGPMVAGPGELALAPIYQLCDLSIRRSAHPPLPLNPPAVELRANSLEDLANPANRFAHSMLPVANGIWSMPHLALGSEVTLGNISPPELPPQFATTRFLNSAFVLSGDRLGEDLLATDLLAFDVRAYDPSAPIIEYNGLTLRPGDPGFGTVGLPGLTTSPPQSSIAAYGEFVDLNWAGKLNINYASELSGRDSGGISSTLYRSGLALGPNGSQIFQPSYDTFTNLFESDGILQAELANRGLVQFSPTATPGASLLREGWRSTAIDAGTDGIDNNPNFAPGIDDSSELESSPPFPVHLRGLQISIRLEDSGRKQFKQMSTVKEFVTN